MRLWKTVRISPNLWRMEVAIDRRWEEWMKEIDG